MTGPAVGVVGASARAAAVSLARAGLAAWAADLFADRDLRRIAPAARCPLADYPAALPALADRFPPGPVLYTGGLENHPAVVAELADRRGLWGNDPAVLEGVRDPFRLRALLLGAGLAAPRLVPPGEPLPADGRWLSKPIRSAGGIGIRPATPGPAAAEVYTQEFIPGVPLSAVFVSAGGPAFLFGVTEQLIGEGWLHARPFHYAGTIGPAACAPPWCAELHRLGSALAEAGLRGVWGADFVLNDGRPFVVEVNPRYPASMEVLELGFGTTVLHLHAAAFGGACEPRSARSGGLGVVGKAVYCAPRPVVFPPSGPWDADLAADFDPWRLPDFADIPAPGEPIPAGAPVLTFFAAGSSPDECRARLQSRATELDDVFSRDPKGSERP